MNGARTLRPPVWSKAAMSVRAWGPATGGTATRNERYATAPIPPSTNKPTSRSRSPERVTLLHPPERRDEVVDDQNADGPHDHGRGRGGADPRGRRRARVSPERGDDAHKNSENERLEQAPADVVAKVDRML